MESLMTEYHNNVYNVPDNRSTERMKEVQQAGLLAKLTPREREMVEKRFGLLGEPPYTLQAIANGAGVGRERVRQIIRDALERIAVDPWE